jgi:UDP-GlcNAc:undecaprenyl-phosphate GlcNAc-1-phosphate transferase
LSFLLALLVSAVLTPAVRAVCRRFGYVTSERPGVRPKARFGGVAIAVSLFACAAATGVAPAVLALIACTATIFAVGLVSDAIGLKPAPKLLAQIAVASVFLVFDLRLYWAESALVDSIITVLWVVAITSSFSLLDNLDGLSAGMAVIALTAFLFTVLPLESGTVTFERAQYLAILLGAIAGFLIYNVHPASVAMGEGGSLLIGLNMAALPLEFARGHGSDLMSIVAVPVFLLLIPVLDAALSALAPIVSGRTLDDFVDRSSHNRLVAIGLSERNAVGLLWLLGAIAGLVAVIVDRSQGIGGVVAAIFTIGMALLALYLTRFRIHDEGAGSDVPGTILPLGLGSGYRRRLVEMLLDAQIVSVAYYGAYRLRFEGAEYTANVDTFIASFPIVLGTQMVALFVVGAYRGLWRYFGLTDGVMLAKGVLFGAAGAVGGLAVMYRFEGYSPGVFLIYGMLALLLLIASRASFRLIAEYLHRSRTVGPRLVVYGADEAGFVAVRHLMIDSRHRYRIIGFVDDEAGKRNVRVHGYRVIGGYDHLVGMIMAGEVDAVAVTKEGPATSNLAWLCSRHRVRLHLLAMHWHEIEPSEPVAALAAGGGAGGAVAGGGIAEARVLAFTAGRTDRVAGISSLGFDAALARTRVPGRAAAVRTDSPVRVVHIITRLILGGAQENTVYTAIAQHRDPRFDVTVLCGIDEAGEGDMFTQVNRAGVTTVVLPSLMRELRPFSDVKAFFEIYRFLRQGSYTIVHTHSSKAGIIGRLAARAAGVPVVVHTIHGLAFHEYQARWRNRMYIALERACARFSDALISVSDRISQTAVRQGIGRPDQHVTIHSGIDLDVFLAVRDRLAVEDAKQRAGIPAHAPVVGKVARFFELKGHEQFLTAAQIIARHVPEAYFLLVGDGPLRDHVRAEADRLGFGGRLVIVGRVPPETVPQYLHAMDVVVHTSLREGIARVLPQAGAVGKPVVTFDLDGAPEVVRDGVCGYLVPPLDCEGIARRVIELLRDPDRRRAFGEAGRTFASAHFGLEHMVERINHQYFELLALRGRRPAVLTEGGPPS